MHVIDNLTIEFTIADHCECRKILWNTGIRLQSGFTRHWWLLLSSNNEFVLLRLCSLPSLRC